MLLNNHNIELHLLDKLHSLSMQLKSGRQCVFDPIRKKWLVLQPEELVRQLLIQFISLERNYPLAKLQVEKAIRVHSRYRRFDLVVFSQEVTPWMIIECKAPEISITQAVFDQIAAYNLTLQAPYLVVTNGKSTYCAKLDTSTKSWIFLSDIPYYDQDISA